MADSKLVFLRPADGSGRLVFGDSADVVVQPTEIGVDATFAGDTDCTVQLLWDAGVHRGERLEELVHWQDASPVGARSDVRWQDAEPVASLAATAWQDGAPEGARADERWQETDRLAHRAATAWQDARTQRHTLSTLYEEATRLRASAAAAWQDASARRHTLRALYEEAIRLRASAAAAWQDGVARRMSLAHASDPGQPARIGLWTRWQDARRPPAGVSRFDPPVPPVEPPCYDPATLGRLDFIEPAAANGRLVFWCVRGGEQPGAPLSILPARYYMAVHSLTCHRLPDMVELPIKDVSLSADMGSFAWSFSASGPVSLFESLAPSSGLPAQVRITLDGLPFVFVVESLSREERFGQRGVRLAGRSATALLASPFAREAERLNTTQATAQQLALQALDLSGFALDWGLSDWLVPAGAWSHSGTPLAAVQTIAEAAGGYLQSHRTAPTLLTRHPYPELPGGVIGAPWNWGGAFAADVELAPDALITTGIERRDGPDINSVWVRGTTQGVQANVKRDGTAGDKDGGLYTDPLITGNEAALQRGLSVLGAAGPKHLVSLSLPLLTGASQPGLLDVGQLVQVNAAAPWRGRVRSVSVSAAHGQPVRQAISLERHLETT